MTRTVEVGVITCKRTWTTGRNTYAVVGQKYRINEKRDDGLFFESDAGLKWVSREEYPQWFISSSDDGYVAEETPNEQGFIERLWVLASQADEEEARYMASLLESMAKVSELEAQIYADMQDHQEYLEHSQEFADGFRRVAEEYRKRFEP